jgi:hypothetical protein
MRILKFLHKPAKAVDQRIDAGEPEQPRHGAAWVEVTTGLKSGTCRG